VRFLVNLIYDQDNKGYVADVPELPGCMSEGETVEAALRNVKEAISLYVEAIPPKKRKSDRPAITTTVEV
jgi:predicted RNase H-like HicB family nuclease